MAVKVLRPGMAEVIDRDLALLRTARRPAAAHLGRRAAAAPARGDRRVRQAPARRTRPDARGGQRQPAAAQLRGLAAAARAGDVLGLLRDQRADDGAHARHPDRPDRADARRRHRPEEALARRRGDLLHPGVPRRLLPRRHAPGQHPRGRRRPDFNRYIALDFGIVGTLSESDKNYLAQNFLAFFRRDYRRVARAARRVGLGAARHPRRRARGGDAHRAASRSSTGR